MGVLLVFIFFAGDSILCVCECVLLSYGERFVYAYFGRKIREVLDWLVVSLRDILICIQPVINGYD